MQPVSTFAFRILVVLSAVMALGGSWLNSIFLPALPVQHSALVFPDSNLLFGMIGVLNLLLGLTTTVGLCLFWRWSRPASLVSIGLSVVLYAMSSYFVDSGVKVASDWLSGLLGGAVLSIAYFSPIANRFGPARSFRANLRESGS